MLLCFLAYVIAILTSYTLQFMNCLHCLLDKTMWNQQFVWLATTPKSKGYTYNRQREKVEFQLHHISLWQLPDSSYQLFVLWQFRKKLRRKVRVSIYPCSNIQLPIDAFNVLEACDKMVQHATNGSVVSIQELYIFKTSMPRFMFTIFATTKK